MVHLKTEIEEASSFMVYVRDVNWVMARLLWLLSSLLILDLRP
jgi:hypothetical protein